MNQLDARNYIECSAYTGEGIVGILEAVIEVDAASPSAPENTSFVTKLSDSVKNLKLGSNLSRQ